jgi:regulatory protein
MVTDRAPDRALRPARKPPRPIDAARLEAMALAYVARFATSRAKLEGYLARKLRERGWEGECAPPVEAIAARFVAAGYIDDAGYARARSGSLLRRGYGERRVGQVLAAAGIDEETRGAVRASARDLRRAALALARKRRFGPFGRDVPDRAVREKQLAAMLRAGHRMDSARAAIDAATVEAAEAWAEMDED